MHILVLWSRPSGYLNTCLNALVDTREADVFLIGKAPAMGEAPFDLSLFESRYKSKFLEWPIDYSILAKIAHEFQPDLIVSGGTWRQRAYRRLLSNQLPTTCRVVCMDTQWVGSLKQWLMVAFMYVMRTSYYDKAFVAGYRQKKYARRLGFSAGKITTGLYSCDHAKFSVGTTNNVDDSRFKTPSFLFVGRLVTIKGVRELIEGYRMYRKRVSNPWPLQICGVGELESLFQNVECVKYAGFVQPSELPEIMSRHTTLLLPSIAEPWGVVIHEAVSAGMTVICSKGCGAGDSFVREGYNGTILKDLRARTISDSLAFLSNKSRGDLCMMSKISQNIALTNTPEIWAKKVLNFRSNGPSLSKKL